MQKIVTPVIAALLTGLVFFLIGAFKTEILVPGRAVVAFDSEQCPNGWEPLSLAGGKFIIGADNIRPVGATGGDSEIVLTTDHLPRHDHDAVKSFTSEGGSGRSNFADSLASSRTAPIIKTSRTGRGLPVEILPPWYALKYCRKT